MARKKGRKPKSSEPAGPQYGDDDYDYRQGASVKALNTLEDIGKDSEDEFHEQRERIDLEEDMFPGRRRRDEDEDSEDEVFGLDIDDSDEEDEDEDDDEDEQLLQKLTRDIREKGSDDEEADEEDDLEGDDKAWGRSRKMFYDADEADEDEDAKEEEAEALRLQKLMASQMREEDFMDDFEDSFAKRVASGETGKPGAGGVAGEDEDDLDHLAISSSLPLHLLPSASSTEVEVLARGATGLSEEEQIKVAESSIPEVVQLLREFEGRWEELRDRIGPAVRWKCGGEVSQRAMQYLQLKYRLLISYLTNVSFYMSLRAHPPPGLDIKTHPVVDTLVTLQELLDEVETKVEGRIPLSDDDESSIDEDEDGDEAARRRRRKRKRKEKRRSVKQAAGMSGMMAEVEEIVKRALEGAEEPEEETLAEDGLAAAMAADDVVEQLRAAKKTKKAKKAKKSAQVDLPPSKVEPLEKTRSRFTAADLEIPEIEYRPIANGKSKKKKAKKAAEEDDFGEEDGLDEADLQDKLERKRSLKFHVTRVDQAVARRQRNAASFGDDDIPYRDRNGKVIKPEKVEKPAKAAAEPEPMALDNHDESGLDYEAIAAELAKEDEKAAKRKRGREDDDYGEDLDDGQGDGEGFEDGDADLDLEDPLAFYEAVTKKKKAKEEMKKQEIAAFKAAQTEKNNSAYDENDFTDGAKRGASWQILANKGLTPHRPKKQRNARVKKREKYEKAKKRLSSFRAVAVDKSKVGAYGGEATGIKKNISKSVRF
ncbi:hypothetical protein HK104_010949 [Borealophlyctis nickersoniae]|nr:hypothetical protein HK104_010949 [Borealophlyctis nickersoniae]